MSKKKRGRRSLVWFLSLAMLFTAPGTPSVFAEEVVEESQESQEIVESGEEISESQGIVESEEEIPESQEIISDEISDTDESIPEGDPGTEDPQDDDQETSPDDDQGAPQDDDQEAPSVTIQATFSGPDQTYCLDYITEGTKVTLVVRDNKGLSAVTINGILVSGSMTAGETEFTYEMSAGDRQTILATDQSGNQASLTVNVKGMHNYKQGPVEMKATCTRAAYTGSLGVCTYCENEMLIMYRPSGKPLGHDFQETEWKLSDGTTTTVKVCSRCGILEDDFTLEGEHHWAAEYTVDKEVSCTEEGFKSIHCTDPGCDARKDITPIQSFGHRFGPYYWEVEASCTQDGIRRRECLNCDYYESIPMKAYTHQAANKNDCTKPTVCKWCGIVLEEAQYSEHSFGGDYKSDMTNHWKLCQNPGCYQMEKTAHSWIADEGDCTKGNQCSECGYVKAGNKNHKYGYRSSEEGHWLACDNPGCTVEDKTVTKHTRNDDANCATPIYCRQCGYMVEPGGTHTLEIGYDNMHHWTECTNKDCLYSTASEAHHSSAESSDCTKGITCDSCGYQMTAPKYKAHNTSGEWLTDGTSHWKVCQNPGCTAAVSREEHNGEQAVKENIQPATCTTPEIYDEVVFCSICGEMTGRTENVTGAPALGHSWSEWVEIDPVESCEDSGYQERTCKVCGEIEINNLNASAHEWESSFTVDKEATCLHDGSKSIHCKNCSAVKDSQVIPAAGHIYGDWIVEVMPGCDTTGLEYHICTVCGEESSRQTQVMDALGHKWNTTYTVDKPANCTIEGSQSIHCSVCGTVKDGSAKAIPAHGHTFGAWEDITSPDCDDSGARRHTCDVCGIIETENLKPTGHDWEGEYVIDKVASCTESGSMSIHCANCDAVKDSIEIPARGHSFGDWEHVDSPTCDASGSARHICEICGYQETQNVASSGHDWQKGYTVDIPASCSTDGSMSIHCNNCDTVKDSQVIPALGHAFGAWEDVLSPGCDKEGSQKRTCTRCDYVDTRNVIGTGHQWDDHYTTDKQATCVEDGSESIHCANCNTVKDSRVITALGHAFGEWEHINSPACDAEGSERHQCTVCGYTEVRNIISSGHNWEKTYTVDVAASCTTDGSESIHCSRCDAVKDSRVIPASGHSFTNYVMTGGRSEVASCDNEDCEATDTRSNLVQVEDETDSINANTGNLDLEEILEENGLDRYARPIEIILSQGDPETKDTESLKEILASSPESAGYEFADAFEVSLSLYVDGVSLGNITKDFGTLMLSFFVGKSNANRQAVIFQMHGEDILTPYTDLIVNDEGYVTITVDKLSAFAVAVGKKAETAPPPAQPDPPASETSPAPEEEKVQPIAAASSPKTGDEGNACEGLFLLFASASLALTVFRRYQRRYH